MRSILSSGNHGKELTDEEFVPRFADALIEEENRRQRAPDLPPTNTWMEGDLDLLHLQIDLAQEATRILVRILWNLFFGVILTEATK